MKNFMSAIIGFYSAFAFQTSAFSQDITESSAHSAGCIPGVRYTSGAVTVAGWEKVLTDNDPNLARWNWSAMTSFTQSSYQRVAPGYFVDKNSSRSNVALKPTRTIYKKSATLPLPKNDRITTRTRAMILPAASFSGTVNGSLCRKEKACSSPQLIAKSYRMDYSNVSAQLRSGMDTPSMSVHGRIR